MTAYEKSVKAQIVAKTILGTRNWQGVMPCIHDSGLKRYVNRELKDRGADSYFCKETPQGNGESIYELGSKTRRGY